MRLGVALAPFHNRGFDPQPAALRHGVPGVHRQVHDHLLQLVRIGVDRRGARLQFEAQLHVFAHQARQHRLQFAHHAVEIEHARLQDLFAAESQQLLSQRRGAFSSLVDLFQALPAGIVPVQRAEQHPAVAVNHRQQVIKIVGDAAGQPADRFHFLRLHQLRLQSPPLFPGLYPLADVAAGAQDRAFRKHGGVDLGIHHRAVGPPNPARTHDGYALCQHLQRERVPFRLHRRDDRRHRRAEQLHPGDTGNRRGLPVDFENRPVAADHKDGVHRQFNKRSVLCLRAPQLAVGGCQLTYGGADPRQVQPGIVGQQSPEDGDYHQDEIHQQDRVVVRRGAHNGHRGNQAIDFRHPQPGDRQQRGAGDHQVVDCPKQHHRNQKQPGQRQHGDAAETVVGSHHREGDRNQHAKGGEPCRPNPPPRVVQGHCAKYDQLGEGLGKKQSAMQPSRADDDHGEGDGQRDAAEVDTYRVAISTCIACQPRVPPHCGHKRCRL